MFRDAATHAPGVTPVREVPGGGKTGSQILLEFLQHINPATSGLEKMLVNRTPTIDNASGYGYVVHQGTEQNDLATVLWDLVGREVISCGRQTCCGALDDLVVWGLLAPSTRKKRRLHDFVTGGSETSSTTTLKRTSPESAMANFTLLYAMPVSEELLRIGGER